MEENIDTYACTLDKECTQLCSRHLRQNSPTWFSGWVTPTNKEQCEYIQKNKLCNIMEGLFK